MCTICSGGAHRELHDGAVTFGHLKHKLVRLDPKQSAHGVGEGGVPREGGRRQVHHREVRQPDWVRACMLIGRVSPLICTKRVEVVKTTKNGVLSTICSVYITITHE